MALDVEKIVKDWINSRSDLVGPSRPIKAGAHLKNIRHQGCYVFLISVGTPIDLTAERPIGRARISATINGSTKEVASKGAIAYVSVLETLTGAPEKAGDYKILVVDNISGPIPIDDQQTTREQFRYLVDADFWLTV